MDLNTFAQIVDTMVIQQDYPGFEPRSLRLGLPEKVVKAPTKMFGQALSHDNVYVKLAALRWFQERPGVVKSYANAILGLLKHQDEWVKREAIRTIESMTGAKDELALQIAPLLHDKHVEVRRCAAKAIGKISSKSSLDNKEVIETLKQATLDPDMGVRFKAQKALRQLGHYLSGT